MPKPVNAFITNDGIIFGDRIEAENYEIQIALTKQFSFTPEVVRLIIESRLRLEKLFQDVKKDHCNVLEESVVPDQAEVVEARTPHDREA